MDTPLSTALDVLATATSTAWEAVTTAIDELPGAVLNDTSPITIPPTPPDEVYSEGNYVVNTILGLLIVLGASVLNALGLNITKLDHQQQQAIPKRERGKEYLRPLWLAGMGIYIASQVFGSPLALRYLRPDWVAPLGASSLIFNFMFAYWLVGTPVTTSDIRGTALIVFGVILIVVFSSINHGLRQDLPIEELNRLWTRGSWISYFVLLIVFTFGTFIVADLLAKVSYSRNSFSPLPSPTLGLPTTTGGRTVPVGKWKQRFMGIVARRKAMEYTVLAYLERMFARSDDARVQWLEGVAWAVAGGSLAGMCLVFTKGVVKIFWNPGHPLVHPSPLITLLLTIITAVLQIICLNKALKCADTVVVVPLFYAGYTVFGFVNSLIFYDQTGAYATWALVAVFLSIAVLIAGVVLLSTKSTANDPANQNQQSAAPQDPGVRLRPRDHVVADGASTSTSANAAKRTDTPEPGQDVLWEVGSVSDDSDDEDDNESMKAGKGVGGIKESHGERGGLLLTLDEEDQAHLNANSHHMQTTPQLESHRPLADDDEEDESEAFGDYARVSSSR